MVSTPDGLKRITDVPETNTPPPAFEGEESKPVPVLNAYEKKDLKITLAQCFNLANAEMIDRKINSDRKDDYFRVEVRKATLERFEILKDLIKEEIR